LRLATALTHQTPKTSTSRHKARHRAPLTKKKVALRAAKVAPAVAVAGALVAAIAAHGSAAAAPSADAGRASMAADARAERVVQPAQGWFGPYHAATASQRRPARQRPARHATLDALKCTGTTGMLPQNYAAIVEFLTRHGYTRMAAAGMAGNMYQESMGNPESVGTGGGGLIGFTPLPAGYVTGNPAADLHTQLEAVLTYNQQWAQYIPALNAATTATEAADIYMNYFERPGIPAAYNRESAADAVAAACGF
jgi:Phage tail lysozyme